jgi:hypothetical protein
MVFITAKPETTTDIHETPNNPTMKGFQCQTPQTRRYERNRVETKPVIKNMRKVASKAVQATDGVAKKKKERQMPGGLILTNHGRPDDHTNS